MDMSLVAGWDGGGCGRKGAGLQLDSKGCGGDLLRWGKVGCDAYPWGQFPLGARMSFEPVRREFSE